jgi:hypothetical protein
MSSFEVGDDIYEVQTGVMVRVLRVTGNVVRISKWHPNGTGERIELDLPAAELETLHERAARKDAEDQAARGATTPKPSKPLYPVSGEDLCPDFIEFGLKHTQQWDFHPRAPETEGHKKSPTFS